MSETFLIFLRPFVPIPEKLSILGTICLNEPLKINGFVIYL
jgi:hypothetical protein